MKLCACARQNHRRSRRRCGVRREAERAPQRSDDQTRRAATGEASSGAGRGSSALSTSLRRQLPGRGRRRMRLARPARSPTPARATTHRRCAALASIAWPESPCLSGSASTNPTSSHGTQDRQHLGVPLERQQDPVATARSTPVARSPAIVASRSAPSALFAASPIGSAEPPARADSDERDRAVVGSGGRASGSRSPAAKPPSARPAATRETSSSSLRHDQVCQRPRTFHCERRGAGGSPRRLRGPGRPRALAVPTAAADATASPALGRLDGHLQSRLRKHHAARRPACSASSSRTSGSTRLPKYSTSSR